MNMRVDLILAEEQRSASVLNVKSLLRIGMIVGPAILGLLVAYAVFDTWKIGSSLNNLKEQTAAASPKKRTALALRSKLNEQRSIRDDLYRIHGARIAWHQQLSELQKHVPAEVQFTKLSIQLAPPVAVGNLQAHQYTLLIEGKAKGATSEANLGRIKTKIQKVPVMADLMDDVRVKARRDRDSSDNRDRSFSITCTYKPQTFEPRKPE